MATTSATNEIIKSIFLQDELSSKIHLIGGSPLANIFGFGGQPVYEIPPSGLNMPFLENDDFHLYKISLIHECTNGPIQRHHYQLDELLDTSKEDNGLNLRIPLSDTRLLGHHPSGSYTLRVYKRPYLDWNLSFIIIPNLKVSFEQDIYLPYQQGTQSVYADMRFNSETIFSPDSPASITQSYKSSVKIQTPLSEDAITGTISINPKGTKVAEVSIMIRIPKIRWRFDRGDDNASIWCDHSKDEELWLGNWLSAVRNMLHIKMPGSIKTKTSLNLRESSKVIPPIDTKENIHSFDLKTLEDSLREGPSLEYFDLMIDHNDRNYSSTLFSIRTRWEAKKIKAYFIPGDNEDRIDVSWKELGKTCEKSVSLWQIKEKKELLQNKLVSQKDSEATFNFGSGEITSGKYQICLEVSDPWKQVNVIPKDNAANSVIFEIFIETHEEELQILSLVVRNTYRFPRNMYRIKIISHIKNQQIPKDCDIGNLGDVLITPINENWLVGVLDVNDQPRVLAHLEDTNPVKLEYDPEKKIVTSIEDRHGDGAMFCYECYMLFWCQETLLEEKSKFHQSYGPVEEFHIKWIEDAHCIYWGDIDTHGFAILNRARSYLPRLKSLLMDEQTLLCHKALWVEEKQQHSADFS